MVVRWRELGRAGNGAEGRAVGGAAVAAGVGEDFGEVGEFVEREGVFGGGEAFEDGGDDGEEGLKFPEGGVAFGEVAEDEFEEFSGGVENFAPAGGGARSALGRAAAFPGLCRFAGSGWRRGGFGLRIGDCGLRNGEGRGRGLGDVGRRGRFEI